MLLVYIGHLYSLSYLKFSFIHRLKSHDKPEKGSLTGTVRTDHPDNAIGRKHKVEIIEKQLLTISLGYMFSFNNLVS